MQVGNVSAEDDYFNYLLFDSYVDGYSQSLKLLLSKPDDTDSLTGDVSPRRAGHYLHGRPGRERQGMQRGRKPRTSKYT